MTVEKIYGYLKMLSFKLFSVRCYCVLFEFLRKNCCIKIIDLNARDNDFVLLGVLDINMLSNFTPATFRQYKDRFI